MQYRFSCAGNHYPYIIRTGDTLYKIAVSFGVSVASIYTANPGINPNNLMIGDVICIPVCPPNSFPVTIQAGDTIAKLAQVFNVSITAILEANPGVNPNNLRIGQVLCIPLQCNCEDIKTAMQRVINELVSQSQFQRDSEALYGGSNAKTTVVGVDNYTIQFDAVPVIFTGNFSVQYAKGYSYPYYITDAGAGQKILGVKDNFGVWETFGYMDETFLP